MVCNTSLKLYIPLLHATDQNLIVPDLRDSAPTADQEPLIWTDPITIILLCCWSASNPGFAGSPWSPLLDHPLLSNDGSVTKWGTTKSHHLTTKGCKENRMYCSLLLSGLFPQPKVWGFGAHAHELSLGHSVSYQHVPQVWLQAHTQDPQHWQEKLGFGTPGAA